MKLNFDDVKESKMVPEGDAELTIFGAKEQRSQNGTNMLVLDMKDAEEGYVRDNVCLEGPGAFRAQQLFNALGVSVDEVEAMQASDFIGMTVNAVIEIEEYNGQERSKVKKYVAQFGGVNMDFYRNFIEIVDDSHAEQVYALCPFHSDRVPSFTINTTTHQWYCHGCGEGGGYVSFLQKFLDIDKTTAMTIVSTWNCYW